MSLSHLPELCSRLPHRINLWLFKFFRQRLLTLNTEAEIVAYLEQLDQEVKAIKDELLRMCWYMRGGITYGEILYTTVKEREIIGEIIKGNLETTKESRMPFF